MQRIKVSASKEYDVTVGGGILENAGGIIREAVSARTVMTVTDDTVDGLYADVLEKSLAAAGFECVKFVFPHSEKSKNLETYGRMLEFAAQRRLTRDDCIVALGGGVVGDMAGFCAGTYLRGIDYVQIPTTLLAMVDSSVGGKTAVDLKNGKNLVGVFCQPSAVIADTNTLSTLPGEYMSDGFAEVIKYSLLFDGGFFEYLNEHGADGDTEYIVSKCVGLKRDTVEADEREAGQRALLNLGHTLGHAIEKCSSYTVSHGFAVAIGTVIMSRGAYRCGLCEENITERLLNIYGKYSLPVSTPFDADELLDACYSDKKRRADGITLVIPERIGECRLYKTDFDMLRQIIIKGLTQ